MPNRIYKVCIIVSVRVFFNRLRRDEWFSLWLFRKFCVILPEYCPPKGNRNIHCDREILTAIYNFGRSLSVRVWKGATAENRFRITHGLSLYIKFKISLMRYCITATIASESKAFFTLPFDSLWPLEHCVQGFFIFFLLETETKKGTGILLLIKFSVGNCDDDRFPNGVETSLSF